MLETATISAGFVRGLMNLAMEKGASLDQLTQRSGIDAAQLHDPDNRIGLDKYVALMRAGQILCNDPALALHFGESTHRQAGIGCVMGDFAETGADSFALFNRYSRLNVDVNSADRFVLSSSAGQLWIIDTRPNPNDFPELTELTFACIVSASRQAVEENQFIKEIHVTHEAPAYRAEYERIFRIPVIFGSTKNALLTDTAWLSHRNDPPSPYLSAKLTAHAEILLKDLENSRSIHGRVEHLLIPILHTGEANADRIAADMGFSRHTLFRKLKVEGTSFERVFRELRHKLALRYLDEKKLSVSETARLLGFSDPAAFSRAFKRWTGLSPRQRYVGVDQDATEMQLGND